MMRILPPETRFAFTCVRAELNALRSALRLNRPLSPQTIKNCLHEALDSLDELERAVLCALNGVDDCPADLWDEDDRVVLGPAAEGSALEAAGASPTPSTAR